MLCSLYSRAIPTLSIITACQHVFFINISASLRVIFALLTMTVTLIQAQEKSLIVIDNQTGYILHNGRGQHKLQMDGVVTIATAMVTIDWMCINQVSPSIVATVPHDLSFTSILRAGDTITLRDLIYCTVLSSDCGAAQTLSDYIGSRLSHPQGLSANGNVVLQMNLLARHLGMSHTFFFLKPGGRYVIQQSNSSCYSTVVDIARLIHYIYQKAQLRFYANQASRIIQVIRKGEVYSFHLRNSNQLLCHQYFDKAETSYNSYAKRPLILIDDNRTSLAMYWDEWVVIIPRRLLIVLSVSTNYLNDGHVFLRYGWRLYDEWVAKGRPIRERNYL